MQNEDSKENKMVIQFEGYLDKIFQEDLCNWPHFSFEAEIFGWQCRSRIKFPWILLGP